MPSLPAPVKMTLAIWLFAAAPAVAQIGGRSVPAPSYFLGVSGLYDGEYSDTARTMLREQRSSIKLPGKWIDSICYHAMRGEALYQAGAMREALVEFNRACELHLAFPTWMQRVKFQQPPRPDANPRRIAPWGQPMRQVTYARLPDTMLITYGQIDNTQVADQGGVVRQAQFWKINVAEVIRATALAIRRRNQLLGPLGPHDKLSRELADTLVRGGAAPPNHWSQSWIDLLTGLAQLGVHKPQEAAPYLLKAQLLDGRYDHQLTGATLLAQAQQALMTGDGKLVPRLAYEAALAAYAYEDWDVLCDALALGHVYHLASGAQTVDPRLPAITAWADRERADHITALVRLLLAEQTAVARDTASARRLVNSALPRRRDVARGRLGPYADYVGAMIAFQSGDAKQGKQSINKSLSRYAELSLTNFQLTLANEGYDSGELSPRVAVDVYQTLLTDPSAGHWGFDPMDAMASLLTNHEPAFDRWISASIARRETLPALYAADLAKRRRFFNRQALGGRMLALRTLLESPSDRLTKPQKMQRQALEARTPAYRPAADQATKLQGDLAGEPTLLSEEGARRDFVRLGQLGDLAGRREQMLYELALQRLPATLSFPPRQSGDDIKELMVEGDALLVFHQLGDSLHGFLVAKAGEHYWRLPNVPDTAGKVGELLRAMGNHSSTKSLSTKDLQDDAWRQLATELGDALLRESRLDISLTKRLVIVPDGPLWHLPFETLIAGEPDKRKLIADTATLRYAPTMGLAFGDRTPLRPVRHTGIVSERPASKADEREMQQMALDRLTRAVENPIRLPAPSPVASPLLTSAIDALVCESGDALDNSAPYEWSPAPIDRNPSDGQLGNWPKLPLEGPERLLLAGTRTHAENGLKGAVRRGSKQEQAMPLGQEVFHAACTLMASGARTAVIARWQTGGATHRKLVQEMASEWTHVPAADAWRRSVSLARAGTLDPYQEPRYRPRGVDEAPPKADHPFFWSGYLLLDTGYESPVEEVP